MNHKKKSSILMGQMRKKMKPGMNGSKKVNHSSNNWTPKKIVT